MRSERGDGAARGAGTGPAYGTVCALGLAAVAACLRPAWPQTLALQDFPRTEVFQDSALRVTLRSAASARLPDDCGLYHGPVPAGTDPKAHPYPILAAKSRASDSAGLVFAFAPADKDSGGGAQLGLGFHYVIGRCGDGASTPEVPLWVASRRAAVFTSPKSVETSSAPAFAWTPVPGVPAYHLLLSDQAIKIDPAKGTAAGASVIWQAITTGTSIVYGVPDPSGTFAQVPAPPLSPGVPYNLVILDNYDGRSALATSSKAQGLKLFTVQAPAAPPDPPANLAPAAGEILSVPGDSVVAFRWTRSRTASGGAAGGAPANTYQLFVYSLEQQNGLEVLIPIWRTEVTDTAADLDAKRVLLSGRYVWKVFALSESGAAAVGDTTSFLYRNDVQTLSAQVSSAADGAALGNVRITLAPKDGNADPLPLFTGDDGYAEKTLAVGGYALAFAKDGYLPQSRAVDLGASAPLRLRIALAPAGSRITGRVADSSGLGLANVAVSAAGGGRALAAQTDAQGFFLLGAPAGAYALAFAKPDYQARPDTAVAVADGETLDLGTLTLARAQAALSGTVANTQGAALPGCDVTIRAGDGTVSRTLRTDGRGAFSAFLIPGTYAVTAARAGFASETRSVRLDQVASLAFALAPGASLVKGRVSLLAWPEPGAPRSAPLPGAAVELIDRLRGTRQAAVADLRGEFSFSADTGTYLARASAPGRGLPDSVVVRVAAARATYAADLALRGFAAVQGLIRVVPDTVFAPAAVSVSLLDPGTFAVAAAAIPQPAPAAGNAGAMAYSLEGVPDGGYRLACGAPGYGTDSEATVVIRDGLWKTGLDLTLRKAAKTLTFAFSAAGASVPGAVRLLSPLSASAAAGARFGPVAAGAYLFDAVPDSLELIPVSRRAFTLPSSGAADTTLNLAFPFSHHPVPLAFSDGKVSVVLEAGIRPDSAAIVYGYGAPADTFRASAAQLAEAPGPVAFRFAPGPQGGRLAYFFRIRAGALVYANEDPARRFRADVEASRGLAYLKLSAGDSLRLPARTRGKLYLHAYDAAGRSLDSLADAEGEFRWQADSALGVKLDRRSKRALTYQTAAPTPSRRAAAPKRGAATRAQGERWDTVRVTLALGGVERTLSLPARVVDAKANKLELESTLGGLASLDAPQSFGLIATAYDTTFSPPIEVVPDPVISLDPPEAGSVSEMRVGLDPGFFGPLRVLARQVNADGSEVSTELGAGRDSLERGVDVGQIVRADDTARVLFHDRRLEARVPDSAFAGMPRAVLRLYRRGAPGAFSGGTGYAVDGPLWEISNPSGAVFVRPLRLLAGLPSDGRAHAFKRFEAARLAWADPRDSAVADTNSFGAPALAADIPDLDGNYYGLWGASRPLTAGEVRIIPNPFSPLVLAARDGNTEYGARIRLEPESDRSAEVTLTAKIYTRDGELVRTVIDHKTVPKGPVEFYWDGKADGGRWARNGRYLLEIAVNATGSGRMRYAVKPIVVFR